MNLQTLRSLAIGKVLGPSKAVTQGLDINEPFVDALINEGLHKIERATLWKFSEAEASLSVTAGTSTAPVPADLALVLAAFNEETERELTYHDERQKFRRDAQAGHVEAYSLYAGALEFYPAAKVDTLIALRYYKAWPDLVVDSDEPIFPETWHDILSDYAAMYLVLRLPTEGGKYLPSSAAEPYKMAWQSGLQKMLESPLTLPTADIVPHHRIEESMYLGEGADW